MGLLVDNSTINHMALQFVIIIVIMLAVGFTFALALRVIKAPQWLIKPAITLGVLIGMYLAFQYAL